MVGLKAARYAIFAFVVSLLAAYPWVWGISYSKGNDFFYWVHFAWWVGLDFLREGLPDWTMLSGCGQPAFNLDHIPDALLQGLFSQAFGLEGGIRALVVLCFVLAGLGTYVLGAELVGWRRAALVGALAYVFSWHMTRTADFYVYTSNLLQFALLPWIVLTSRRGVYNGQFAYHCAVSALLAICVMANPQTAIKVAVVAGVWLLLEWGFERRGAWLVLGKHIAVVGLLTAVLAISHIAIALAHRTELHTFGKRGVAAPMGWSEFINVPLFLFDFICEELLSISLADIPLGRLVESPHLGLSVVTVALFSIGYKGVRRQRVRVLWLVAAVFLLGYFAASRVNPSEWIGTPRKMVFALSFCGALLASFGARRLMVWRRLRHGRWCWAVAAGVLIFIELMSLKSVLYVFGTHHVPLQQIPQVRYWRQIASEQQWDEGDRFYTFQPDLTFMLYPALVGKPVANRIHQRDYTAEFFSYQDTLNRIFVDSQAIWPQVSEYLALANIRYLELPRDGFSGRFKAGFPDILGHFNLDAGLRQIGQRTPEVEDADWYRYARGGSGGTGPIQVAFENKRSHLSFVPRQTLAIMGDTRRGEKLFEQIALSPDFVADQILFLLCAEPAELANVPIDGYLLAEPDANRVRGIRQWSIAEVVAQYKGQGLVQEAFEPELIDYGRYRLAFEFAAQQADRFIFVSLQRFADWHAYNETGKPLRIFMSGAGLTAVLAPADSERVVLEYERPSYKSGWRNFSLVAWGLLAIALLVPRIRGWNLCKI